MKKLIVVVLIVSGCKQSYREAWETICDAPKHVTATEPAERAMATMQWIDKHVTNPKARKHIHALASVEGDKTTLVKSALRDAEIDPKTCALLTSN